MWSISTLPSGPCWLPAPRFPHCGPEVVLRGTDGEEVAPAIPLAAVSRLFRSIFSSSYCICSEPYYVVCPVSQQVLRAFVQLLCSGFVFAPLAVHQEVRALASMLQITIGLTPNSILSHPNPPSFDDPIDFPASDEIPVDSTLSSVDPLNKSGKSSSDEESDVSVPGILSLDPPEGDSPSEDPLPIATDDSYFPGDSAASAGSDDVFTRPPFPPLEFPVPPYPDWLSVCQRAISWIQDKIVIFRGLTPHDMHSSRLLHDTYSDHARQVQEHTSACDDIIDIGQNLGKKSSSPSDVSVALAALIQVRISLAKVMRLKGEEISGFSLSPDIMTSINDFRDSVYATNNNGPPVPTLYHATVQSLKHRCAIKFPASPEDNAVLGHLTNVLSSFGPAYLHLLSPSLPCPPSPPSSLITSGDSVPSLPLPSIAAPIPKMVTPSVPSSRKSSRADLKAMVAAGVKASVLANPVSPDVRSSPAFFGCPPVSTSDPLPVNNPHPRVPRRKPKTSPPCKRVPPLKIKRPSKSILKTPSSGFSAPKPIPPSTRRSREPASCPICHKEFVDQYKRNRHVKQLHGDGVFQECDICGYKVRGDLSHLKDHLATHTGEKRFACRLCPFKAIQAVHLRVHMKSVHPESPLP